MWFAAYKSAEWFMDLETDNEEQALEKARLIDPGVTHIEPIPEPPKAA